ncbi:MAG: DMT family transporter [Phycisphaerae bacterium]|jgi:drug/metabolite transporter (DMT)-like permease
MWLIPAGYIGYAAGITTSCLWTGTSFFFTSAGRRLGPTIVNTARLVMAVVLLGVTYHLREGGWIPPALPWQVVLLALSGVIGLAIGDQALFTAFVAIGPRLSLLIMTTAPLLAALFGWLALGEVLSWQTWIGVGVTLIGVAWVVLERPAVDPGVRQANRWRGMLLAFVGAACQAGGLLFSKQGMGHGWLPEDQHLNPQTATLIRMFFAALGMLPALWFYGRRERRLRAAGVLPARTGSWSAGVLFTVGGAVLGPFLGVWMSLVAVDREPLGVGQTLISLPPVLILPFAWLIYKERIGVRAVVGALVAVLGVALMSIRLG